jgi:HPt (histidine-containing phosphotransfer) domain-containing protein
VRREVIFDQPEALARVAGEQDLFVELVRSFLEGYEEALKDLKVALDEADKARAMFAAHRLKGVLATLSAHAAHDVAADIEQAAVEGQLEIARTFYGELDRELSRLIPVLHTLQAN